MDTNTVSNDFVTSNGIYYLNHSVGRPLVAAQVYLQQHFFSHWYSGETWGKWMYAFADFQKSLAKLLHSHADNFCPQTNLSSALTKILFSIPKRNGKQRILLSENDFPTIGFVAQQAKTLGYDITFLPHDTDQTNPQVWIDAFGTDVQWVHITHVQSNTGQQIPVKEIVAEANRRNILSVVDVAQSAGVLPIDADHWNASFIIGSCVKWLCGGPGAGYLWVNPAIVESCQPVDVGWFSHEKPFEFDIHNFNYHPKALRFWGGTPSVAPYILAAQSIDYLATIGISEIRKHNVEQANSILSAIERKYVVSPTEEQRRSGTLVLNFEAKQQLVIDTLKKNNIHFDTRKLGIRISPHIYNTVHETQTLIQILQSVL